MERRICSPSWKHISYIQLHLCFIHRCPGKLTDPFERMAIAYKAAVLGDAVGHLCTILLTQRGRTLIITS